MIRRLRICFSTSRYNYNIHRMSSVFKSDEKSKTGELLVVSEASAKSKEVARIAKTNLGFAIEELQEELANKAKNKNTYPEYLEQKRLFLTDLRNMVVKTYGFTYTFLREIGFPEKEAEKRAKEMAENYKSSLMIIFETLYPSSGKEVKRVY